MDSINDAWKELDGIRDRIADAERDREEEELGRREQASKASK